MGCGCGREDDDSDSSVQEKKKPARREVRKAAKRQKSKGSTKDKDLPTPVTKKKSGVEKNAETPPKPPTKKEAAKHQKRGSKAVAPPPALGSPPRKKSTLKGVTEEGRRSIISVDVSKFVKEGKGEIQDRYTVQKVIGRGAYGEVRMIRDKITNDLRAMKVIPKETCTGVNSNSITNEIQVLKSLDHPNILKIYEFYQDDINYYLVTEFCSGGELYDRIIAMRNFSEAKAAQLMKQILSAVTYCHNRKIVHRDIKPENLLFESPAEEANLKVIDFGTSIIFGAKKMRQKLGTPYYIAPEVLMKSYDQKCDVWSCGVILYILLSGIPPFSGNTDEEILKRVHEGKYSIKGEVWEKVSVEAKRLIARMLTYDPEQRITAYEALNDDWIVKYTSSKFTKDTSHVLSLKNLQSFKVRNQLQQAVVAYIANHLQSQETMKKLQLVFQQFDQNGDGVLERDELLNGYMQLGKSKVEATRIVDDILEKIDINNNGTIDYSEFLMANLKQEDATSQDKLKEAFKLFDKDGNGQITLEELKAVLGEGDDDEAVREIIRSADADGDGEISYPEFIQMMCKLYKR